MKVAIFPGSFDPFTKGHESVVLKALDVFDKIIIAIGVNTKKQSFYPIEKRKQHIESLFNQHVEVIVFEGLTVELCKKLGANDIIRGLRDVKDFEYAHINSSIVREISINGGDISSFVTNAEYLV